jgi:hypothetical protein
MDSNNKFYRSIIIIAVITLLLLMIPLIAMQFTDEVVWTLKDFVTAGVLLFGTAFTYKLITRRADNKFYKIAAGLALASGLFLIWANLAVGIIGSENNPINVTYFGVVGVGISAAIISQFKPKGMAFALFATALSLILLPVIVLTASGLFSEFMLQESMQLLGVHGFFFTLFLISGILFRLAAKKQSLTSS